MKKIHRERTTKEGIVIPTRAIELTGACILNVEAGTNGYCGGDSGHGCRTIIILRDLGGVDMNARFDENESDCTRKITLEFGGDDELRLLIKALKFIRKTLKKQALPKEEPTPF